MLMESKTWCRIDSIFLEGSFPLTSLETPTPSLRRAFGLIEFAGVIFKCAIPSVYFILNKTRTQNILGIVHFLKK